MAIDFALPRSDLPRIELMALRAAPTGNPAEAVAWLRCGRLDEGIREALRCLASPAGASEPLLQRLRENPFLQTAIAPPYGYEGDAAVIDLALGLVPLPVDTSPLGAAMYHWMAAHSTTFAACHARRLEVQLVDFDARVLGLARRENAEWGELSTRQGSLAEILAGRFPLRDCGLVYLTFAGEHLSDHTLAPLLEALLPALRPFGEIVLPAFTRLPEQGLLEQAADWLPNVRSVAQLLHLARGLEDVTALVHEDPALGVAYLHLERRPRASAPRSGFRAS